MKKLRWMPRSLEDLRAIRRYIAQDNPRAARRWVERLRERARAATKAPKGGRRVPEIDRDDVREVIVGNYRIIYRIRGRELQVLTVIEGHRLLPRDAVADKDD